MSTKLNEPYWCVMCGIREDEDSHYNGCGFIFIERDIYLCSNCASKIYPTSGL